MTTTNEAVMPSIPLTHADTSTNTMSVNAPNSRNVAAEPSNSFRRCGSRTSSRTTISSNPMVVSAKKIPTKPVA